MLVFRCSRRATDYGQIEFMKAAVLEDVRKMAVRQVPDPELAPHEVLLRVRAVGVCGTDLHLFQGHGNYNFDSQGRPIPLTQQPQILGHEFAGEIAETGREVKDLKTGVLVLCDQGENCHSQRRHPLCAYCSTGDLQGARHHRTPGGARRIDCRARRQLPAPARWNAGRTGRAG